MVSHEPITTGQLYETLRSNVQRHWPGSMRYTVRADRLAMRLLRFTAASETGARRRLYLAFLETAIENRLAVYHARIALTHGTPAHLTHDVIRESQWRETLRRLRNIMAID